jgi:hypothetical protein
MFRDTSNGFPLVGKIQNCWMDSKEVLFLEDGSSQRSHKYRPKGFKTQGDNRQENRKN